jgi:transcriptional regulator GlxA family with amidase domain
MERRRRQPTEELPVPGENRHRYYRDTVTKAMEYLEQHFSRPLDASKVARFAGVSPSHLRRLVHRETGMSLSGHLKRIRIESAKHLLMWSSDNIDKIALRVGYESASHFSTLFKRMTGMTPSDYTRSLGTPEESMQETDA